jgi:nucleoid-associated protein YgaU
MERRRRMWPDDEERKPEKPKIIATHTVQAGDTLSAIALKYYGSAVKEKYMHIYEANKAIIGDDPNLIKAGMELEIPELPD